METTRQRLIRERSEVCACLSEMNPFEDQHFINEAEIFLKESNIELELAEDLEAADEKAAKYLLILTAALCLFGLVAVICATS